MNAMEALIEKRLAEFTKNDSSLAPLLDIALFIDMGEKCAPALRDRLIPVLRSNAILAKKRGEKLKAAKLYHALTLLSKERNL